MFNYPISVHRENDHYWSSCSDVPEAHSTGSSLEELLANAVEGIQLALSIYVDQGREIPTASEPEPGQNVVNLPVLINAKATLWNAMLRQGMRVADLARLLGLSHPVAARLIDFEHASKIEQLERALKALNTEIRVSHRDKAWIELPYGGAQAGFYVGRLVDVFHRRNITEMVTGAVTGNLDTVKKDSLDYLLRTRYARNPNTMQAVQEVFDQLEESGLFEHLPRESGVRTAGVIRLRSAAS